ncbi:MAG: PQQ-dependent sugar dehydrogenase, partial [Bacteroidota bacterium]
LVESGSEPGLLGMALHPDFLNTPTVYLAYTYVNGFSVEEKLVSYTWNGTMLTGETTLLSGIDGGGIHNGARLLITTDNKILMTTGDVGSGNLSQNSGSLNGKILRINMNGSIPSDNPTPGNYIYSTGHRNPQGLAYGPNGQIYSSEHGAQQSDEFNIIEAGRNYGWPSVQGACNTSAEIAFCNANNVMEPLSEYSPCVAVNGLCYYEHPAIPEWDGKMLMAVLGGFVQDPRLTVLEFNAAGTAVVSEDEYFANYGRIRDVCVNPHTGAIYFATNGPFYPSSGPNRIIEYRNLDYVTSVDPASSTNQFMEVGPVPARAGTPIRLHFSENFIGEKVEVLSYTGATILSQSIDANSMELSTAKLSAGNYYLKATNDLGTITRTIVIQ